MSNIETVINAVTISLLLVLSTSCNAQEKKHQGGPYYYESFANYEIPFRPIGELTSEQAKSRDSYYIAYFNDNGAIVSFEKYLHGKSEFSDRYIYKADGVLERRELTKASGEITTQYFDKNGKMIKK